ncbi:hypothetical protein BC962_0510 [Gillisia mitskevichiae]|uniref:Uncharacterized protein n=1 Tax=Gillisia mitskevichiae TaxID=270921 RepID=A0A495PYG2_9FLAO|nr:hypothetical protein [Gillisia mitskevichiae]RKS55546.1 hypothetical protein BC962_0510 [Gillisia mitskevichiae]
MRNRLLNITIIALSLSTMIACKDENKEVEASPANLEVEAKDNSKTTAALNPVHGEPGHRCDLPVGAPLDQAASTSLQQNGTIQNPNVSPVRVNGGDTPAVNPPHGQPGHDCSKPVGADLN